MKKIVIPLILSLILTQNIYASEVSNIIKENNNLKYEYEVNKEEKDNFIESLEKEINYEEKNYKLLNYNVKEQDYTDIIEISDIQEITTNSNSLNDILNILPKTISYDKDGYIGTNNLDYESIEVTPIYNGYYEEYIDEVKQYFDLTRNDMDFIPKEIEKDGYTLYLINVDWYKQTSKNTGDFEIADLYRGEAFYRGVKRIYNPYTYRVIAKYNGNAKKNIVRPYLIEVNYEEIRPEIEEVEKNNIVLPVTVATTSSIFFVLLLLYFNNKVRVYCNGRYIGSYKIKDNVLTITDSTNRTYTNNYLLKFNKKLYKKYKGRTIKFVKGTLSKHCQVLSSNVEVSL